MKPTYQCTQHRVHLTGGILRHFRAFSTPEQNPALKVSSRPAHPQVPITATVKCREKSSGIELYKSNKTKSADRALALRQIFYFQPLFFLFMGMLRHPRPSFLRAGVAGSLVRRSKELLRAQTKFGHPHQNFVAGGQSSGYLLAHKACDVSLNAYLHQTILGKLFVGQASACLFLQTPRQE